MVPGWAAAKLSKVVAEALCQGLAAAWQQGQPALVQAQLMLPEAGAATASEHKVGGGGLDGMQGMLCCWMTGVLFHVVAGAAEVLARVRGHGMEQLAMEKLLCQSLHG